MSQRHTNQHSTFYGKKVSDFLKASSFYIELENLCETSFSSLILKHGYLYYSNKVPVSDHRMFRDECDNYSYVFLAGPI